MAARLASRLEEYFQERTNGNLRSIVIYEPDDSEIIYLRGDVADQYTKSELNEAVDDSRMESLSAPIYENLFSHDHGDITCLVKCFENVIEMNFVLADGKGTAVALDSEAMADAHGLVAEARQIVIEERE